MNRGIKGVNLLITLVFLFLITGCQTTKIEVVTELLTITSIVPLNDKQIEVEFSNGLKIQINEFTPSPLISGKNTEISFVYNGETFRKEVTWTSEKALISLEAISSNVLRAQFSDGSIKRISSFNPNPLQNLVPTEVTFIQDNVTYYGVVTLNAPVVTSITAIDPVTIEVTFSSGSTIKTSDFLPTPLQNETATNVQFTYLDVVYNQPVTWYAPQLVKLEAINTLSLQATFDNGIVTTITDFSPKPLPYNEKIPVTIHYYGVSYTGEVELDLEEVTIEVSDTVLRQVNIGHILGGNMGAWVSSSKLTDQMVQYVRDTGAKVMRFPGGNLANSYCWELDLDYYDWDTGVPYEYDFTHYHNRSTVNWTMDVHDFLAFTKKIAAVPMYSVNPFDHYVDGVKHDYIEEAVHLVKLFKQEGYVGAFYEIGNENMGSWNPMLTLDDYTNRFILLAEAIRQVDPQAKILGPVTGASDRPWFEGFVNRLVAQNKLHLLDYITFHFYGYYNLPVDLSHPETIQAEIDFIRNLLDTNGGQQVKIAITEYNSALWGETKPNNVFTIDQALWTVDFTGQMLVNKIDLGNIWITLHPGSDPHTVIDDQTSRPSKNYWASYIVNRAFSNDSGMIDVLDVTLSKTTDEMTAYVVLKGNGKYGLVIVNKEELNKQAIISIENVTTGNIYAYLFTSEQYNANTAPISTTAIWKEGKIEVEVPAYGIVMININ